MLENKTKLKIEEQLSKLFFVNWDRYTNDDETFFVFYGWINREKDSYKDFVVITYQPEINDWWAATSSAHYSETINRLLGYNDDEHNHCIRIENDFNVPNLIKLSNEKTNYTKKEVAEIIEQLLNEDETYDAMYAKIRELTSN